MTEQYNKALNDQLEANIWDTLKQEATSLKPAEYAQLTADIAGIFDPTPISDTAGLGLSLWNGDWLGAGISVVGYLPYLGDTLKPVKIARLAPRTAKAIEGFMRAGDNLAKAGKEVLEQTFNLRQVAAARKAAAERVREAMLRCRNNPNSRICEKVGQLQMPRTGGKWNTPDGKAPTDGNGTWTFEEPKTLPDGRVVESVEYKNGFPDFDQYTYNGKHDIWDVSGNAKTDADRLHAENPNLPRPDKDDYVLHHFDDGTVGYVPREIHDRGVGAAHSGGNSIVNNDLF